MEAELDLVRAQLADAELKLKLRASNSDARMQTELKTSTEKCEALAKELQIAKSALEQSQASTNRLVEDLKRHSEHTSTHHVALESRVAALDSQRQTLEEEAVELRRQLDGQRAVATKAAQDASEASSLACSETQRGTELAAAEEAARATLGSTKRQLAETEEKLAGARGDAEMAATRLRNEASAHRACKAKLLAAITEQRSVQKFAAAAEGKAAAAEAALQATKEELYAIRRQHAAASERLSEAEARAEYLRSASVKERDARQHLIDEAKALYARRATGSIVRLVVVAPTVRVQMPQEPESRVRPRLPISQLRAVLRDDVLPPFVRIFRRAGESRASSSSSKSRKARPSKVTAQEPWLQELVRDLESGIEHQLRETFADLGVRTSPESAMTKPG
jgi:chromosome segregation ATPase